MIGVIAVKEIRSLIHSPVAWVVAALVQLLAAYFFIIYLDYFIDVQDQLYKVTSAPGLTELVVAPLFVTTAIIFLIIIPILTMRLVSEERNRNTLALLLSAPVSMLDIVLGKFFGILCFIYTLLILIALMPLSLLFGIELDLGLFFSSFFGVMLVSTSFIAIGLFMSTLTQQPVIAATASWALLLFLWLMELSVKSEQAASLNTYLSMLHHYTPMMQGILNSADIAYYLLVTTTFLALSVRRLDAIRLGN
ncbi:MAG: ABC transporter permease [Thiohalomonadales bacterium]